VDDVALTSNLPFLDGSQTGFWISGRPIPAHGEGPMADYSEVSEGYFRAMGVPVLRGRAFDARDTADAPQVVLVDELMVQQYFPDEDPLGKQITNGDEDVPENRRTIIGVVPSMRMSGMNVEPPRPQIYFPYTQSHPLQTTLLVRGSGDPERLTPAIRSAVLDIDPDQPLSRVQTMGSVVDAVLAPWRLNMLLVGLLSATATLLAVVGLYGVLSYSVAQRTGEIGVRMAVGAQRGDVVRLVLRQGMGMTLLGIAAGMAVALGLTRLIGSLLYGVSPTDPLSFASVAALLGLTALAACWLPARRAARIDPMVALRCE
jgi:putative ABC transport system permease protein